MENKRIVWIDILKGFLIYLVIFGHCIQYLALHNQNIWDNPVFLLIYSFHMPLFALISGYLFFNFAQKYTLIEGLKRKVCTILIPCIVWAFIEYILQTLFTNGFIGIKSFIKGFILYIPYHNWFLWCIFYCSFVSLICYCFDKNLIWSTVIIMIISFIVPDYLNSIDFKMMYPFFILGFLFNRFNVLSFINKRNFKFIVIFGLIISLLLIYFLHSYESAWAVYSLHNKNNVIVVFARWIVNLVTSVYIFILFSQCTKLENFIANFFMKIGKNTLGIYMVQGIFFIDYIQKIFYSNLEWNIVIRMLYAFVFSIVLTLVCYIIVELLKKNLTASLLLGIYNKKSL